MRDIFPVFYQSTKRMNADFSLKPDCFVHIQFLHLLMPHLQAGMLYQSMGFHPWYA